MLPNKMRISEKATKSLMRFQHNTGLTPNIGARLAFFSSLERGYRLSSEVVQVEQDGRELDKHTWLGSHTSLIEMLLKEIYPDFDARETYIAWAAHIEDGVQHIETKTSLASFLSMSTQYERTV